MVKSQVAALSISEMTAGNLGKEEGVETMRFAYNESSLSSTSGNQP